MIKHIISKTFSFILEPSNFFLYNLSDNSKIVAIYYNLIQCLPDKWVLIFTNVSQTWCAFPLFPPSNNDTLPKHIMANIYILWMFISFWVHVHEIEKKSNRISSRNSQQAKKSCRKVCLFMIRCKRVCIYDDKSIICHRKTQMA